MPPAPLRLQTPAYVQTEESGAMSRVARFAAGETLMGLLWSAALLGILITALVAPHMNAVVGGAIVAGEVFLLGAAIALSIVWERGHRTPVLTEDALILEGLRSRTVVSFSEIARVEIVALAARERPFSRVTVQRHVGSPVRLDLPQQDALVLCRALQSRLFGVEPSTPYEAAMETLDRTEEPIQAWVARLRERFATTGYRHGAGIADDDLDRALHDARLPTSRRVGAALAMCASAGTQGAERVLRIKERLETGSLRIALERVAQGTLDEDSLAAAEAEDEAIGRTTPSPHTGRDRS